MLVGFLEEMFEKLNKLQMLQVLQNWSMSNRTKWRRRKIGQTSVWKPERQIDYRV